MFILETNVFVKNKLDKPARVGFKNIVITSLILQTEYLLPDRINCKAKQHSLIKVAIHAPSIEYFGIKVMFRITFNMLVNP